MDKGEFYDEFAEDSACAGCFVDEVPSYNVFMNVWGEFFPHLSIREVSICTRTRPRVLFVCGPIHTRTQLYATRPCVPLLCAIVGHCSKQPPLHRSTRALSASPPQYKTVQSKDPKRVFLRSELRNARNLTPMRRQNLMRCRAVYAVSLRKERTYYWRARSLAVSFPNLMMTLISDGAGQEVR
jgi:hypothetical protein